MADCYKFFVAENARSADRVELFLQSRGYVVESVSARVNDDGSGHYIICADRDPEAEFATYADVYTPLELKREQAISEGRTLLRAIWNKAPADRTNAEKIALALGLSIQDIQRSIQE